MEESNERFLKGIQENSTTPDFPCSFLSPLKAVLLKHTHIEGPLRAKITQPLGNGKARAQELFFMKNSLSDERCTYILSKTKKQNSLCIFIVCTT